MFYGNKDGDDDFGMGTLGHYYDVPVYGAITTMPLNGPTTTEILAAQAHNLSHIAKEQKSALVKSQSTSLLGEGLSPAEESAAAEEYARQARILQTQMPAPTSTPRQGTDFYGNVVEPKKKAAKGKAAAMVALALGVLNVL